MLLPEVGIKAYVANEYSAWIVTLCIVGFVACALARSILIVKYFVQNGVDDPFQLLQIPEFVC